MSRILKEKATVPLFFAQTLVQSMRDVGYNNTTSPFVNTSTIQSKQERRKYGSIFDTRAEAPTKKLIRGI